MFLHYKVRTLDVWIWVIGLWSIETGARARATLLNITKIGLRAEAKESDDETRSTTREMLIGYCYPSAKAHACQVSD